MILLCKDNGLEGLIIPIFHITVNKNVIRGKRMNPNNKAALMEYIEFHVDHLTSQVEKNVPAEYVPVLWKMSKDMLTDIERTFDLEVVLSSAEESVKSKK